MPPNINMIGANPQAGSQQIILKDATKRFNLRDFSYEEEQQAIRAIHEAAYILDRRLPDNLDPLLRKYYDAKYSDTIYAFGVLAENRKYVERCQGWSVQLALQLAKKVLVYDTKTKQWFQGDRFEARLPSNNNVERFTDVNRFVPCQPPNKLDKNATLVLPSSFGFSTQQMLEQLL